MFTLTQTINYVRNLADNNIGINFDGVVRLAMLGLSSKNNI